MTLRLDPIWGAVISLDAIGDEARTRVGDGHDVGFAF